MFADGPCNCTGFPQCYVCSSTSQQQCEQNQKLVTCPNRDVSVNEISQSVYFQSINRCLTAVVSGGSKNFEKGRGAEYNLSAPSSFIANAHNGNRPPPFESATGCGLYFINSDTRSTQVLTINDSFETIPAQRMMLRRHSRTLRNCYTVDRSYFEVRLHSSLPGNLFTKLVRRYFPRQHQCQQLPHAAVAAMCPLSAVVQL